MSAAPAVLVFTDLDGTLLDHHDYSHRAADPMLAELAGRGAAVIPVSSKTAAEIAALREELALQHPFIVENGAAVFIPEGYFDRRPAGTVIRDGFWVREWVPARSHWLQVLAELAPAHEAFRGFASLGDAGVAELTGLSLEAAARANRRDYSEPLQWLGSAAGREALLAALRDAGANPLQGGRFLAVAGDCDKGRALAWLRARYCEENPAGVRDIAAGDSGNDVAMLEAAGAALLVRSPVHEFPALKRRDGVMRSTLAGPAGWAEGIAGWLTQLDEQQED